MMDKLSLKEPVSPVLSSNFYALFKNEDVQNPSTSLTFPQKSKTPQGFRSLSTAVSDDPTRLQPRFAIPHSSSEVVDPKIALYRALSNRSAVKRRSNVDLNSLRVLRTDAEDEEHALETKANSESVSLKSSHVSNVKAQPSELGNFRRERDWCLKPPVKPAAAASCSLPPVHESDQLTAIPFTCTLTADIDEETKVSSIATTSKNTQYYTSCSAKPTIDSATKIVPKNESSPSNVITLNGQSYRLMRVLGEGGSSKVYEAYNSVSELVAIKWINLASADQQCYESYVNEISVLKRLQHSDRVIKLFDYEHDRVKRYLLVALERGDTDFASYLTSRSQQNRITPEMIKFYWSEMLRAVEVIHNAGIVHSDLKPANFLIVRGHLKLIDFGISSVIPSDVTSIFKDTRVGSICYMSPEALMDTQDGNSDNTGKAEPRMKIGVQSDVWSLGCILYHMAYGVTPFHSIKDAMKIAMAIVNPDYNVVYPPLDDKLLLDVIRKCIVRQPKQRASIKQLLVHPYLTGRPENNLVNLSELMVKLSPTSTDKVQKALEELQLDKMSTW